jgi:hypothetical protein
MVAQLRSKGPEPTPLLGDGAAADKSDISARCLQNCDDGIPRTDGIGHAVVIDLLAVLVS